MADQEPTIDELLDLLGVLQLRLSKSLNAGFDADPKRTFDQLTAMSRKFLNLAKTFLELASKVNSTAESMADRADPARARKKRARRPPRRGS